MEIVTYGGGTNSTALLIGLRDRKEIPDAIVFSDTGGEKPFTYEYLKRMKIWCKRNNFPKITIVRKGGNNETLEEDILRRKTIPSVAFGYKTCSSKYKIEPFEKWCNHHDKCQEIWESGGRVIKIVGIDADETRRARISTSKKFENRYPLIEWDWGRDDCIDIIKTEGLPLPGKSSCFFCPNTKPKDILLLPEDLKKRAIEIEHNFLANEKGGPVRGLGRNWSWSHLIETADRQESFYFAQDMPCGCYDG